MSGDDCLAVVLNDTIGDKHGYGLTSYTVVL